MKLSNTALRELSAKYRDILKKCAIFNAAILMGVAVAMPAMADQPLNGSAYGWKDGSLLPMTGTEYIYNASTDAIETLDYVVAGNTTSVTYPTENTATITAAVSDGVVTINANGWQGTTPVGYYQYGYGVLTNMYQNDPRNADYGSTQSLAIANSNFSNNTARNAGGALTFWTDGRTSVEAPTLTITKTTFSGNSARWGGALAYSAVMGSEQADTTTLTDVIFTDNHATGDRKEATFVYTDAKGTKKTTKATWNYEGVGGAIVNDMSDITVNGTSEFSNNTAKFDGGAIALGNVGTLVVDGEATFSENHADGKGGAIYNASTVKKNSSENPDAYAVAINNAKFQGNSSGNVGGAIYNEGEILVKGSTFAENTSAGQGSAIFNAGLVTIDDSIFDSNVAKANSHVDGGAIRNNGELYVTNSEFTNNKAVYGTEDKKNENYTMRGAAIYNHGYAEVDGTKFIGNSVESGKPRGAAVYNDADMTITNSVFQKNEVINSKGVKDGMGSAVYNSTGTLTLVNNLFGDDEGKTGNGNIFTYALVSNSGTLLMKNNTFRNNLNGSVDIQGAVDARLTGTHIFAGTSDTSEESPRTAFSVSSYNNPFVVFGSDWESEILELASTESKAPAITSTNIFADNETYAGAALRIAPYGENRATVIFTENSENIFENNKATTDGGAIYNTADMYFEGGINTFKNNTAGGEGGAIYNAVGASLDLYGTTVFSGNKAGGVANDIFNAGELYIGGDITLDGGIIGNGAVYFDDNTTLTGKLLNSATPLIEAGLLDVGENVTAKLTFDIGDVESETWKYAQADEWTGNDFVLDLEPNALYDVVAGEEKGTITVSRRPTQDIVDDMTEAGATENEASAMAAVAGVSATGDETVDSIISGMKELIQEGNIEAAKELAGKVNPAEAPVQQAISASSAVIGAVMNRMSVVGSAPAPAVGRSGGDWNDDNSPNPITNLSPWIQGLYNKTHNSQGIGFDAYSKGFAFGADTRLNDAWTVGLGYAYTATDIKNSQRKMQVYGDNYFVYGQYKPSNWYVSAVASMGKADYKDKSVLTSTYDVDTYAGQLMAGYQKGLFDNYAGFRYTLVKSDSYDNGLTQVQAKNTNLGTAVIGTKVSKDFTCKKGVTWTPEFRLAGTYDVMSKASKATVGVIGSTATYTVTGDRLSRAALETGVALKAKVKDFELVGGYDVELRSQNNTQAVNLKAIYHF